MHIPSPSPRSPDSNLIKEETNATRPPLSSVIDGWFTLMRAWSAPLHWFELPAERAEPQALDEVDQARTDHSAELFAPTANFDRLLHAQMGRLTLGISAASLVLAYLDWAVHLAVSPGKWQQLGLKGISKWLRLSHYAVHCLSEPKHLPCIEPLPQDMRFRSEAWQKWPYNLIWQAFLLNQTWWHVATTSVSGVSTHHERVVSFVARQLLDMVSPSNFLPLNPDLLDTTLKEGGHNLLRGLQYCYEDWHRAQEGLPPAGVSAFRPGHEVAITEGVVVYRNRLIELIQYSPSTSQVHASPVLIVPAWIMKYYILDLSPHNSLVKYLVDQGHTVFMLSWHNPGSEDGDLGMDDYLHQGVLDALRVIRQIVPDEQVNAVGYCLGGTLLAIAAAYLARQENRVLASVTLLAAQTDFTEAGELMLFIDESQLSYLEDIMWDQGYLDTKQMAGAFQLLRSNDLIWSRMVREYLMGRRQEMTDLMAWNADATRMPYRMHSEYLRHCFLDNDLFEGHYQVNGQAIALGDIRVPMFVVATEQDHVAPWRSVYKIKLVVDTEITFLLTSGGHNAGIVSEPGHPHRHYRLSNSHDEHQYLAPDIWFAATPSQEGSWWPLFADWLAQRSREQVPARQPGTAPAYPALGPAPGRYVLEH